MSNNFMEIQMGGGSLNLEILRGGGLKQFGNLGGRGGGSKNCAFHHGGVDFFWNNPFNNILKEYLTLRVPIAGPGCLNVG